ncbi:hypothetical protein RND71_000976 [Anisodus tanguticus]|uniref:DNA gyrase subunit A n=1 Tax=Anisodus tanguticus TaxID=243964 RepID=A0AAE1SZZ2_9SOLA|nr:hypothetical protein RND71_000976 [Anisodus tanguticus]
MNGPWLLFLSESGYGKQVPVSRFRTSPLNRIEDGESDEQVVLVSQSGTVNRIKVRDISIQSRGVILMRLEHAGKIQSASLISAAEVDTEGEDAEA